MLPEYPVNVGIPQDSILRSTLFCCKLYALPLIQYLLLLSMLMILISTESVIKVLIYHNSQRWTLTGT